MHRPDRRLSTVVLAAGVASLLVGCSSRSGWEYAAEPAAERTSSTVLTEAQIATYPSNWSIEQVMVQGLPGLMLTSGNSGGTAVRGRDGQMTMIGSSPNQYISMRGMGGGPALVIVDGVPLPEDMGSIGVNVNDVSRIEVLKDAASTALYGFRGSGGVIVITTKSGARRSN